MSEATAIVAAMHHRSTWSDQQGRAVWQVQRTLDRTPDVAGGVRAVHRASQRIANFHAVVVLTLFAAAVDPVHKEDPWRGRRCRRAGGCRSREVRARPRRSGGGGGHGPRPSYPCDLVAHFANQDGWDYGMAEYVTWTINALMSGMNNMYPQNDGWRSGSGRFV